VIGAKVVLTVAHLGHTPENCDPANLRAWCQRIGISNAILAQSRGEYTLGIVEATGRILNPLPGDSQCALPAISGPQDGRRY